MLHVKLCGAKKAVNRLSQHRDRAWSSGNAEEDDRQSYADHTGKAIKPINILFGPIHSRRFGKSLGVDLSPSKKQCNFDCIYCELEPAKTVETFNDTVKVNSVIDAIGSALETHRDIDVLTITANGEPTLYPHLLTLIKAINKIKGDTKTLILSNGSTIADPAIQDTLLLIDTVKLSLDCATQKCMKRIDRVHKGIDVEDIKRGLLAFKSKTSNPLIIEILMVKGINDKPEEIAALNAYLLLLQPDRIDLGTIDRPPAYAATPLSYKELRDASLLFDSSLAVHITQRKTAGYKPSHYTHEAILSTLKKRPLTQEDIEILFDRESQARLATLLQQGKITKTSNNGITFFTNP